MLRRKKRLEVVEEVVVAEKETPVSDVTIHDNRWDGTVNKREAPKLPSLDD